MNILEKIKHFFTKEIEVKIIDLKKGEIVSLKDLKNIDLKGNVLDENKRKLSKVGGVSYLISVPESWLNLIKKNGEYVSNYLVQLENGKRIIIMGEFE